MPILIECGALVLFLRVDMFGVSVMSLVVFSCGLTHVIADSLYLRAESLQPVTPFKKQGGGFFSLSLRSEK
jgi:hypothetical protein